MKRTLIRVLATTLTIVMLVTMLGVFPMTTSAEQTSEMPVLAYVPLDDRPVVTDRVQYAAVAAGFNIQLPPDKSWYQTHLDNQLFNTDDTRTGNTDERQVGSGLRIMDWLEEMEDAGCDHYIIHLDMMFSGGLVGSRYPDTHYDNDGYLDISEQLAIAARLVALSENPENHVYFIDTVMRLASTSGFKGYKSDVYNALRSYSRKGRPTLNANNWKTTDYAKACAFLDSKAEQGAIKWFYQKDENWNTISPSSPLTQSVLDLYHLARHRKARLINYMIQYAPSSYYVIGVDDASPKNTIQTNEIKFIEARMQAMGITYNLFADADSLGLMALARCSVDYHCGGVAPKIRVKYYGSRQNDPADQYDIGTLQSNVEGHLECAGVEVTEDSSKANLQLLILTRIGPEDPENDDMETSNDYTEYSSYKSSYESNINNLVARANENIANNIPTIVMDCSAIFDKAFAAGGANLQDALVNNCTDLGRLIGYSNWNTAGNTIGISIGQGVSRYAYLAGSAPKTAEATIAAAQSITYSYVKDIIYVARHKQDGKAWMWKYKFFRDSNFAQSSNSKNAEIGLKVTYDNNGNMYETMLQYAFTGNPKRNYEFCNTERYLNNSLEWEMGGTHPDSNTHTDSFLELADILMEDTVYTDLHDGAHKTSAIGTIKLSNFRMPWYRLFEITFNIAVEMEDVYTYENGYISVQPGTEFEGFAEDVRVDKTVKEDTEFYSSSHTYTDYRSKTITLASPGPAIYTQDSTADVSVSRTSTSNALVGTGYKVTINGTAYYTVVNGDVSSSVITEGDGKINTQDARDALRYVVGSIDLSDAQLQAANMDGSSSVGSNDARRILQKALGMA